MMKLMDDSGVYLADKRQDNIGTHLVFINWSVTSSGASLPTLSRTALATKKHLTSSKTHLNTSLIAQ